MAKKEIGLVDTVAALAHRIWCISMQADGWSHGEEFDEALKRDPLLCDYEQLPASRRAALRGGIEHQKLIEQLEESASLTHSIDEWTLEDLEVGLRVGFFDMVRRELDADQAGVILDWVEDDRPGGRIDSFRVQWDSGEIVTYEAAATYIVALED